MASPYSDKVIADGAVAYWRLDEASGLSFADVVGTRTATIAASTGISYGVTSALSDGSTGLATNGLQGAATFAALSVATTCTFEFWIAVTAAGDNFSTILSAAGGGSGVYYSSSVKKINCYNTTSGNMFNTTVLTAGVRYHVAIAITAGTGTFYLNGVPDGTLTNWPGQSVTNLFKSSAGTLTASLIDEVAIYPTALTPQQIANHYALRYGQRTYQELVIADGAVAYWKLDESSGTVAKSQVGSYDGTISGGVTLGQPGAIQGYTAMAFDGSTGKIVAPAIAISAAFTLEAWIRTTGQAVQQPILATLAAAAGIYVGVKTGLPFLYITGSSGNPIGSTVVNDGLFHHVVFSNTGTNSNAYVDGQFVGTQAATHSADAALSVFIANGGPNFTNEFFIGAIDEVAIYPTALTPQQIAEHYALRTATSMPAWHDLRWRYCRFVRAPGWRRSA